MDTFLGMANLGITVEAAVAATKDKPAEAHNCGWISSQSSWSARGAFVLRCCSHRSRSLWQQIKKWRTRGRWDEIKLHKQRSKQKNGSLKRGWQCEGLIDTQGWKSRRRAQIVRDSFFPSQDRRARLKDWLLTTTTSIRKLELSTQPKEKANLVGIEKNGSR